MNTIKDMIVHTVEMGGEITFIPKNYAIPFLKDRNTSNVFADLFANPQVAIYIDATIVYCDNEEMMTSVFVSVIDTKDMKSTKLKMKGNRAEWRLTDKAEELLLLRIEMEGEVKELNKMFLTRVNCPFLTKEEIDYLDLYAAMRDL